MIPLWQRINPLGKSPVDNYFYIMLNNIYAFMRMGLLSSSLFFTIVFSVQAVDVIVNIDVSAENMAASNLNAIFSLYTLYWPSGEKIRVFVLPDNDVLHKAFVKQYLHMFPYQLRRTWDRVTYTGTGQPPTTVLSIEEMLEYIKKTRNSIGYIDRGVKNDSIKLFNAK